MHIGKDNIVFATTTTPLGVADVAATLKLVDKDDFNNGGGHVSLWLFINDASTAGTARNGKGIGDAHSAPSEAPT